jgi:dipeptidyl aminopeptidase/acylaminoacyl peptidase
MRVRTILATGLLAVMVCAGSAQGNAGKRPMTFADLMAMKRVSDPQISVSGKWVLFSVTDVSLKKNSKTNHLWVVPLSGGKEVQVTNGPGESNGRFSPDGNTVMYSAAGQIAIAPWDDAAGTIGAAHAVTSLETEADGGIWAPDSKHFVFVSEVYPECESKAAGAQRFEDEASCNAAKDAVASKSPVKAQIFTDLLYRHWDHYVGEKRSHIFYGEVEGGVSAIPEDLTPASVVGDHEAPTFQLSAPLGYAISPDGKEIAYVVNLDKVPAESTNNDVYVLQVGAAPGTAKKVSTSPGSDDGPAYSPDGKWLAWRSQKRAGFESDKFRLVVMDRATGKIRDLMPTFDNWVDEFTWTPESDGIFYATGLAGEENVDFVGLAGIKLGFLEGEGDFSDIRVLPHSGNADDGRVLVAVRMSAEHPSEIIQLPKEHRGGTSEWGGEVAITHLNHSLLDQLDLPKMESFWFAGAGGTKAEGFVVRPPGFDAEKKYPVKFLLHGGPQTAWGDAWSYRWNAELFAADGYVVVMINRRGSTGYGQQFVDEVSGDWGGRPFVDLMKGLDAAEAKFSFIDKTRECALGASYGGYMADWVLTHTDRFKCIVTHDGMYDPVSAFGSTEELWFMEWEFRPLEKAGSLRNGAGAKAGPPPDHPSEPRPLAGDPGAAKDDKSGGKDDKSKGVGDAVVEQGKLAHPWDFYGRPASEDPFRKWSPMMFIKNAVTPTLVVHSQRDYRLDVSQGLQLFTALQLLGVPSKMLYFPDEGHWVLKPQNSELWYETVNDWCDRWTGMNNYAAVGPEKNPAAKSAKP